MEKRVVSALLSCLDQLPAQVFVIAATGHPEALESGVRRGGRFDSEIVLGVPDENQRLDILARLTEEKPMKVKDFFFLIIKIF